MNKYNNYTVKAEAEDIIVAEFMQDLDIALGHEYEQPNRRLFSHFSSNFNIFSLTDLQLVERLHLAYQELIGSQKDEAKTIVRKALALCARSPQGLRRSLVCVDLAHAIDPGFGGEELYSSLLLRPTDQNDLAIWVWQLIRRWRKWPIKVISTPEHWEKAIKIVVPKGILEVLSYYHEQNAIDNCKYWENLRHIALKRIDKEENQLFDLGYDPVILRERIASQMTPSNDYRTSHGDSNSRQTADKKNLTNYVRPQVANLNKEDREYEKEW